MEPLFWIWLLDEPNDAPVTTTPPSDHFLALCVCTFLLSALAMRFFILLMDRGPKRR